MSVKNTNRKNYRTPYEFNKNKLMSTFSEGTGDFLFLISYRKIKNIKITPLIRVPVCNYS